MVDLKARPYYLDEQAIRWVQGTIAGMTAEEKIGQLFINMGASREEAYLKDVLARYHIGGARYNPGPAAAIHEQNRIRQENARIPLLIAANTEAGGNGACTDGTEVGFHVKVAATGDPKYAYGLGRITYDPRETTMKLLVEKLMGRSEFKGVSPIDAFCGLMDTRI